MGIAQVKKEYDSHAHYYDTRWSGYLQSTHDKAIMLADLKPSDSLLDISCGTGLMAQKILLKYGNQVKITGIDISKDMLAIANYRLKKYNNVSIIYGDIFSIKLPSRFDIVFSVSALHHYSDPSKAIGILAGLVKLGGSLLIIDWCRDSIKFKCYNFWLRCFKRSHHNIFTTYELKEMLINNGFKIKHCERWSYKLWDLMVIKAEK